MLPLRAPGRPALLAVVSNPIRVLVSAIRAPTRVAIASQTLCSSGLKPISATDASRSSLRLREDE